jgi:branched-chain amino acid transport system permease protein
MLLGGAISFVIAFLIGAITLKLRGVYFTIFTFGLVELLKNIVKWLEMRFSGRQGRPVVAIDPYTVFYYLLIVLVLVLLASYLIKRSRFGLALQGIGENEDAATHIGINTTLVKILAFSISSFAIGACGAAMATRWSYIDPVIAFNPLMSFLPVLMAIFGGLSSIAGPLIGAAVFAYLTELLITKFGYYYMLTIGIIMIVAILFLPNGLIGLVAQLRKSRTGVFIKGKLARLFGKKTGS